MFIWQLILEKVILFVLESIVSVGPTSNFYSTVENKKEQTNNKKNN